MLLLRLTRLFLWCGITVNSFAVAHIIENGFGETIAATLLSSMAFINAFSRLAGGAIGEWLEPKITYRKLKYYYHRLARTKYG